MSALLNQPARHSAPGQYLGFALQPVRMFYHLLDSPDVASVSLEHLDDVAVHYTNGSVLVEQAKSALAHNPLSDWSIDLWKTMSNWIEACRDKTLDIEKTQFRLYVTPAKVGNFCSELSEASTEAQVEKITKFIRRKLKALAKEPACIEHLRTFLDASTDQRFNLVSRFSVKTEADPLSSIFKLLNPALGSDLVDVICEAGIGMTKERADKCIRMKSPAVISVSEFRRGFHAFIKRNNLPGFLASFTPVPSLDAVEKVALGRPKFIQQLELIEASQEQRLRAVSDYLRTSADKVFWADRGLVYEGSFAVLEEDLLRRHSAVEGEVADLYADRDEALRGRLVYNRCSVLSLPLDGRVVPGHFSHGCFNLLAEDVRLGWHPRYKELMIQE